MNIDIARLKKILQKGILSKLGDEVDLIYFCGSQLTGTTHAYSDIDIMYVPVHESTWDSITVLVAGVMVDLYAVHWSRLQAIAEFEDPSGGILLNHEVIYARTPAVEQRLSDLVATLERHTTAEYRPTMVRKAMGIFQQAMYDFYLLRHRHSQADPLAAMMHAQRVMKAVLHCLMVLNQRCIDTRKRHQVMDLDVLPEDCGVLLDTITTSFDPEALFDACARLLDNTRLLIVNEQASVMPTDSSLEQVFDSAYPELKNDLAHILLACETRDTFNFSLMSLYHELMIHMAQAVNGVEYTDFNTIDEYRQDLGALGFPDLLPYVESRDFDGLSRETRRFDQSLQQYFTERGVPLNAFPSLDALSDYLENS